MFVFLLGVLSLTYVGEVAFGLTGAEMGLPRIVVGPALLVMAPLRWYRGRQTARKERVATRRNLLVELDRWREEGFLVTVEGANEMQDIAKLETLVKGIEARITRLRDVEQALGKIDATEFPEETQALRTVLKDPGKVEEAERRLADLKEAIAREGKRRRARRLLEEGVSLGRRGAELLEEGRHLEAQQPLKDSLERFTEARKTLGDSDPRLLDSIAGNERAVATNLLYARLGEQLVHAQKGVQESERQAFDQAEAVFQSVKAGIEDIRKDAQRQKLAEVEEETARRIQELEGNIEGCRVGKDAKQVEEMVARGNALWQDAEQAIRDRDSLRAKDTLAEAVKALEQAFSIASQRAFKDTLPRINHLRERIQGRQDEVYSALSRGVQVSSFRPPTITPVVARGPQVGVQNFEPTATFAGQEHAPWNDVYKIERPIDQGGYADVFLARRKSDGLEVALKVPRGMQQGGLTAPERLFQDFHREAQNWSVLRHDYIVELYEYGSRPYPWLAMEFMAGGPLSAHMGKLPLRQALDVCVKICLGLEYAHRGGMVHRDLKPQNILLSGEGVPKVSDWGLAKHALFQSLSADYSGTPLYSAPEQIEPARFGLYEHAGDVFQLGILFYEALTSRHPFLVAGEELYQLPPMTIPKRITESPFIVALPTAVKPDLPRILDDIILTALKRDVKERYREVYLLREALDSVLKGL